MFSASPHVVVLDGGLSDALVSRGHDLGDDLWTARVLRDAPEDVAAAHRAYFDAGGQPGSRSAWLDPRVNAACGSCLADTLATLDQAYLRPRFHGFIDFFERSGHRIAAFLRGEGTRREAGADLSHLWARSRSSASTRQK